MIILLVSLVPRPFTVEQTPIVYLSTCRVISLLYACCQTRYGVVIAQISLAGFVNLKASNHRRNLCTLVLEECYSLRRLTSLCELIEGGKQH